MRKIIDYVDFNFFVSDEDTPEFKEAVNYISLDQSNTLWKNYFSLQCTHFDMYCVIQMKGNPIGLHGLQSRSLWNGASRAMSRSYLDKSFHRSGDPIYKKIGFESIMLYDNVFRNYFDQPFFVSREITKRPDIDFLGLKSLVRFVERNTHLQIHYDDKLYRMSNSDSPSSWQYIFWIGDKKTDIEFISAEEWSKLYN